ncbi:hypothetical protein niasHT_012554 [Heterodera trifolii]|uniref:MULE transposase domain-containing protein n=1 Tax=Heterodera trifolii TaxID=157864 RepID=A0ABD2L1B2_9BILA
MDSATVPVYKFCQAPRDDLQNISSVVEYYLETNAAMNMIYIQHVLFLVATQKQSIKAQSNANEFNSPFDLGVYQQKRPPNALTDEAASPRFVNSTIRQLNDSSTRRFVNSAKMRRFVNSAKCQRFVNLTIRQLDDSSTQPKCDDCKSMKSIRKQIEQQHRRKTPKRFGEPSADYDDSNIFPTQREDAEQIEQAEYTASDEDDEENRPLIEFKQGKTERGALCIWHQGFRFTRIRGRWFRCSNRDCEATAALRKEGGTNGVLGRKVHNHLPDPACFHAEVKRNGIKTTTMENPRQKPSKVLAEVRANTKDETFVSMGTDLALAAVMRRQKRKIYGNMDRVNPLNVVLPDALLMKDGESTLLYDSRVHRQGESDVVLLLDVLNRARKISVDGTFKVAPAAWTQCFVIGAFVNRRLALCVHALLPGKQRKYYEEALNAVKTVIAPNAPAHIISDFETATIRAMRETFPAAKLTGCLFHMSQSVFRKWREMGLEELYANDEEQGEGARNSFRKLLALALIPEQHVRRGFTLIVNHAPDGLAAFFGYFARVYVGLTAHEQEAGAVAFAPGADQSRRSSTSFFSVVPRWELPTVRPPLYPVHFWNVHDRARSAVEKTNNAMEASHLQFSRGLVHHPSLSDFLAAILDSVDKQMDIARSARVFPHKRRIRYILKEQLIGDALDEAEYNTDEDILNILSLLSLQMQGYVGGLRARGAQGHEDYAEAED